MGRCSALTLGEHSHLLNVVGASRGAVRHHRCHFFGVTPTFLSGAVSRRACHTALDHDAVPPHLEDTVPPHRTTACRARSREPSGRSARRWPGSPWCKSACIRGPQRGCRAGDPVRPALHPSSTPMRLPHWGPRAWLRYSSLKYSRHSRSSRLARRAHCRPRCNAGLAPRTARARGATIRLRSGAGRAVHAAAPGDGTL